jgi:hypothetical protein
MKTIQALSQTVLAVLVFATVAQAQTLSPEDVQDLDKATGVGCIAKDPVTEKADFYFVCWSSKSGEQAWNAALYRSKVACGKDKFSVYFNVPPSLQTEDGIHGAQVEVGCGKKP